jgi:hypothetical protein
LQRREHSRDCGNEEMISMTWPLRQKERDRRTKEVTKEKAAKVAHYDEEVK